jgi:hypothetical protein
VYVSSRGLARKVLPKVSLRGRIGFMSTCCIWQTTSEGLVPRFGAPALTCLLPAAGIHPGSAGGSHPATPRATCPNSQACVGRLSHPCPRPTPLCHRGSAHGGCGASVDRRSPLDLASLDSPRGVDTISDLSLHTLVSTQWRRWCPSVHRCRLSRLDAMTLPRVRSVQPNLKVDATCE